MPDLGEARQTALTANPRLEYRSGQYLIRLNLGDATASPRSRKKRASAAADAASAAKRGRSPGSNVAEQLDAISRAYDAKPIAQSANPDGELDAISRALRNLASTAPIATAETRSRQAIPIAPLNGPKPPGKNARPLVLPETSTESDLAERAAASFPDDAVAVRWVRTTLRSAAIGWSWAKERRTALASNGWTGARMRAFADSTIAWACSKMRLGRINWMRKIPRASVALLVVLGVMDVILVIQLEQSGSVDTAAVVARAPSSADTVKPHLDDAAASTSALPVPDLGAQPESANKDDRPAVLVPERSSFDQPTSIARAAPRAEHGPAGATHVETSASTAGADARNHDGNATHPASASAPLMTGRAEAEAGFPPQSLALTGQAGLDDVPTATPAVDPDEGGKKAGAEINRPRKPATPPAQPGAPVDQSAASAGADRRVRPVSSARSEAAHFFVQFAAYRSESNAAADCGRFAALAVTEITKANSGGTTWFLCRTAAPLTHRDAAALVETVKSKMSLTAVLAADAAH